jgi:hypothetical protein
MDNRLIKVVTMLRSLMQHANEQRDHFHARIAKFYQDIQIAADVGRDEYMDTFALEIDVGDTLEKWEIMCNEHLPKVYVMVCDSIDSLQLVMRDDECETILSPIIQRLHSNLVELEVEVFQYWRDLQTMIRDIDADTKFVTSGIAALYMLRLDRIVTEKASVTTINAQHKERYEYTLSLTSGCVDDLDSVMFDDIVDDVLHDIIGGDGMQRSDGLNGLSRMFK